MSKKIIALIILVAVLVLGGGGYFIWQKYYRTTDKQQTTTNNKKDDNISKPTEPQYPKAETYQVPILMYHYIRNAEGETELGKNLSVSPEKFAEQMKVLKDTGYVSIKLADLADPEKKAISKAAYDKKKPIVITFDDGYENALSSALPILQENDFIGTFFIIRDFVGRPEYLSQAQIDELEKAGMEIGSHSLDHPDLTTTDASDAQKEITESKYNATVFCYPSGKFNDTVVSLVKKAGYLAAVTTQGGIADQSSNLFELPRVRVQESSGQALLSRLE